MKALRFPIIVFALILAGCQAETAETTAEAPAETPAAEEAPQAPSTILSITHSVADYATWREAYDGHGAVRTEGGVMASYVVRDASDENLVHVFAMFGDSGAAHAFVENPDLASAMQEAGVTGEPQMAFMNVAELVGPDVDPGTADRIMVVHPVADYDSWKASFDEHQGARSEVGLVTLGIGRDEDNPNNVRVMFAARDMDAARAFIADPALAEAMEAAGVTGPPEFLFGTDVTGPAL